MNHSADEYVRGRAHVNGTESFWSMLKRRISGTYHSLSLEQVPRYVREFSGRHNQRERNAADQLRHIVRRADGMRLRYRDLIDHGHAGRVVASISR